MSEQSRTFANFGSDRVAEVPVAAGSEFIVIGSLEFVKNGRTLRTWPRNGSNSVGSSGRGNRFLALEAAEFPTTSLILRQSRSSIKTIATAKSRSASWAISATKTGSTGGAVSVSETWSTRSSRTSSSSKW